jgi:hypothetical protein
MNTPIRAEIVGQAQATACGVTVTGRNAPVLALCRALIEAGHDPATPLEAYRGSTLCLRVRSIGEGAKLTVDESHACRFAPFRPFQDSPWSTRGRSPVDFESAPLIPRSAPRNAPTEAAELSTDAQVAQIKRHALARARLVQFEVDVAEAERLTGQPFERGRDIIAQARTRIEQERDQ